jgi:hypothetical protein
MTGSELLLFAFLWGVLPTLCILTSSVLIESYKGGRPTHFAIPPTRDTRLIAAVLAVLFAVPCVYLLFVEGNIGAGFGLLLSLIFTLYAIGSQRALRALAQLAEGLRRHDD